MYDLAIEEVNLEHLQLKKSDGVVGLPGLNEEIFLAQLHRRSLLLDKEFQDAVTGIVMCHVGSELNATMAETVLNQQSCSSSSTNEASFVFVSNHRQLRALSSSRRSLMGTSDIFTESTDSDGPRGTQIACRFRNGIEVVEVFPAPIKTLARMQEKLLEYSAEAATRTAGGEPCSSWPQTARILDPIRSSIVCNGPAQILEAFQWFSAGCAGCPSKPICRFKNRFSFAKEELLGGYVCKFTKI